MSENGVTITFPDKVGADERGYTYEYFHDRYGRHLLCFRRAGSISGRHYHKGISLSKDPEVLILASGSLILRWKKIHEAKINTTVIDQPCRIEIAYYIWHEIEAVTDCTFIELNALSEHRADTFYS